MHGSCAPRATNPFLETIGRSDHAPCFLRRHHVALDTRGQAQGVVSLMFDIEQVGRSIRRSANASARSP